MDPEERTHHPAESAGDAHPERMDEPCAFPDRDGRADAMHEAIEACLDELVDLTDEARASEEYREWLDVQSRFHDYSFQNTLLIKRQRPDATAVAGYRAWQEEFGRHVREGESAIWIWAPIITDRCRYGNWTSTIETNAFTAGVRER